MEGVTIRPRELRDDEQIIAVVAQENPSIPAPTLEEYRYRADPAHNPPGIMERFVADREGAVLGLYVVQELAFFDRPNTFWVRVSVRTAQRQTGIGGMLFDEMVANAARHGATRLYGDVSKDQPESLAFAERRGFTRTGRVERLSILDVANANLEGYSGLVERLVSEGIEIKTVAEIGIDNEPMLRSIYAMADKTVRDVPGTEPFSGVPFEVFMAWLRAPDSTPDCWWVAFDRQKPVGLARLAIRGSSAFNAYTGVARAYRGRGIARALKLKTIDWARARGLEHIITSNDTENHRMLSVNIPLGYRAIPARLEVARDLDEHIERPTQ
jgi:GNAT superfamily N-acetyltransferase